MKLWKLEISFSKRKKLPTFEDKLVIRLMSLLLGLAVVGLIFLVQGVNPISVYIDIFGLAFFTPYGLPNTLSRMIPLLLISVGLAIPFKARIDNIGAEGQFLVGAIAAAGVAYSFPGLSVFALVPLMFLAGFAAGALWAIPVALFRVKGEFKGADVVLSFLMVFPAYFLVVYLVTGPWKDPTGYGYPRSPILPENGQIWSIPGTTIHLTIILAIAVTLIIFYYLVRLKKGIPETKIGYEIDVMGNNPEAGGAAGMSFLKIALITMIISGGLAGLAGVGEVAGSFGRLQPEISTGLGFTAIAVAYLGGLNPLGIIVSSIFFAGLLVGGVAIQSAGLPFTVVDMFNGSILFFVLLADFFMKNTIEVRILK